MDTASVSQQMYWLLSRTDNLDSILFFLDSIVSLWGYSISKPVVRGGQGDLNRFVVMIPQPFGSPQNPQPHTHTVVAWHDWPAEPIVPALVGSAWTGVGERLGQ